MKRRVFLARTAAYGAVVFSGTLPGLRAAAQTGTPLRRSLADMDLDDPDLVTLRSFVTMMKDPTRDGQNVSWEGFANIHGDFTVGFNLCPHGNWYFLPWHRSYIRMYEQAARALTGNTDFAMPYWDWTANPGFPAAFGDAEFDGQPNPLFVEGRNLGTGDELGEDITGQDVMDTIYGSQTFEEFGSSRPAGQVDTSPMWIMMNGTQGELESNPHNNVHCIVLGPFMCSGASPQDPIFQMHHCNIDRIWDQWNANGNANSSDQLWLDMPFTDNFFDPDGNSYTDTVNELLEVVPLGYTYGLEPPPVVDPIDPGRYLYLANLYGAPGSATGLVQREVQEVEATIDPGQSANVQLRANAQRLNAAIDPNASNALTAAGAQEKRVYAFLRGLQPTNDGTQLRVFVNLPEAGADTQAVGNPNFVTSVGFFGPTKTHDGMDMNRSVAVDLTSALRRLDAEGALSGDSISVQLVPVPLQGSAEASAVSVQEVELAIV